MCRSKRLKICIRRTKAKKRTEKAEKLQKFPMKRISNALVRVNGAPSLSAHSRGTQFRSESVTLLIDCRPPVISCAAILDSNQMGVKCTDNHFLALIAGIF